MVGSMFKPAENIATLALVAALGCSGALNNTKTPETSEECREILATTNTEVREVIFQIAWGSGGYDATEKDVSDCIYRFSPPSWDPQWVTACIESAEHTRDHNAEKEKEPENQITSSNEECVDKLETRKIILANLRNALKTLKKAWKRSRNN